MPTVDVDFAEFERLLGVQLGKDLEGISDVLAFVKGEAKSLDDKEGILSVEIKDTNRPDTWNIEGMVRALRSFLGLEEGLRKYEVGRPSVQVYVDERLESIRPYIACSTVRSLKLTDVMIRGFMHMQDKLDQSYGRNRRRTSIVTIGIQTIMPTTATPQQKPPQPANDDIPMAARQVPPPPGMGKLVDKTI